MPESLHETFTPRPLVRARTETEAEGLAAGEDTARRLIPAARAAAPYSFSSRISTASVPSSAGGMSVMAESSPSAADSFSIFFF